MIYLLLLYSYSKCNLPNGVFLIERYLVMLFVMYVKKNQIINLFVNVKILYIVLLLVKH